MITKTIRLLLLVPFVLSAVFWEGARVLWWVWLRVQHVFPRTFSELEFQIMLLLWRMPGLTQAQRRFEDIFEDDFAKEFWVNYPVIFNKRTWFLHVLLWACIAEALRLILYLWNRTYVLWPRRHSADTLNLQKLTANMPSLRYLDYDVRSLHNPKLRRARMAKLYAEDYVRNQDAYFFYGKAPGVSRVVVDLLWRTFWMQYRSNGGRGRIPELEESVLKQLENF